MSGVYRITIRVTFKLEDRSKPDITLIVDGEEIATINNRGSVGDSTITLQMQEVIEISEPRPIGNQPDGTVHHNRVHTVYTLYVGLVDWWCR